MKPLNVLSLFDGMICGQIALQRLGMPIANYFASEIDKYAIKVTMANFPNTIQLGDVTKVDGIDLPEIDLLIGGSPCQGFSFAGKQLNFNDPRSALFFEFVRLLKECRPKYFFLENVKMKKEYQDVITQYLGVEPIYMDSSLVSAQLRKRLYWTNIPGFTTPKDRNILLEDIIEDGLVDRPKAVCLLESYSRKYATDSGWREYIQKGMGQLIVKEATAKGFTVIGEGEGEGVDLTFIKSKTRRGRRMAKKSNCLTASRFDFAWFNGQDVRLLSPVECERLQTVPDNYTNHVSDSQRYRMLGNGWTVDAVIEFFKHIKFDEEIVPDCLFSQSLDF